jgi:hypothetical protein
MKILVRSDESKDWDFADPVTSRAEAELQSLLIESPSLIPIDEIREDASPFVAAVGEFGLPGSGNTDVLAFSPDGDIAVIECKLAANSESKRKVVGQILEYAAYLWGMDYEEVDGRVRRLRGKGLSKLIEEAIAGEWDEASFTEGVRKSLASGAFILVITVDEISEELRRIIRYVNECSKSVFSLHALEIQRFRAAGIELLLPHLHGVSARPSAGKGRRKQWTEDGFFRALSQKVDSEVQNRIRDLYEWSARTADRVWFGTGVETGSFTFHYLVEGKTISVFTVYTNGRLTLNYGWLSPQIARATLEEFHHKLTEIPAFRRVRPDFSKWPSLKASEAFRDAQDIDGLEQAITWLHEEITSR